MSKYWQFIWWGRSLGLRGICYVHESNLFAVTQNANHQFITTRNIPEGALYIYFQLIWDVFIL